MRQITALIWKEAREQRWILLAAVAIFFGFPLIMATFSYYRVRDGGRFYSEDGLGLVLAFGGLLAIFLALGATCRDLTNPLHDFWR